MEEGSKEFISSISNVEGMSILENLTTSMSLVKKKRRSYGQTNAENESPLKDEQIEETIPLEDDDDGSIVTEVRSFGDHKGLFDIEDEFFGEDEFNSSESLADDDQFEDDANLDGDAIAKDSIQVKTSKIDTQEITAKLQSSDESHTISVEENFTDSANDEILFESDDAMNLKSDIPIKIAGNSASKTEVTDQDILDTVDTLFSEVDVATVTVKDIIRSIEDLFQIKIKKERKAIIKDRLFHLINNDGADDAEDEVEDDDIPNEEQSDYEFDPEVEEDDDLSTSNDKKSKPHSKRTPKQRKPSHLKIHHEMMRKRQLAEAKIRAEELQDQNQKKISEEDRKRAELIAKKFETDTEEMRIKRLEDRIALLSKLEQKRLLILKERKDNSDQSGESDDSDDELDIVDQKDLNQKDLAHACIDSNIPKQNVILPRNKSPDSVLALFSVSQTNQHHIVSKKKKYSNPRAVLRNALKAKQYENGNLWLAKELGYKDVEEHIKECAEIEKKTRRTIVSQEEARIRLANERNERLKSIVKGEVLESEVDRGIPDTNDDFSIISTTRNDIYDQDESDAEVDEEDEEIALAREMEEIGENYDNDRINDESQVTDVVGHGAHDDPNEGQEQSLEYDSQENTNISRITSTSDDSKNVQDDATDWKHMIKETSSLKTDLSTEIEHTLRNENMDESESENEFVNENNQTKTKIAKNAAWKEMLKKEAEQLKKRKALRKNGSLVEDEAEEEEEEEGVAGLEDFGFTLNSKKKDLDEEEDLNDDADDDDFEDIVDSLSDNEGDEEAGEAGRKELALKEEKARHKEIIRRMREGYDGKRGGIAGGGEARGNLRFDQLVAADNRDDARRLGLLNDDELDSDAENNVANAVDEIEDEEDLDKILKDRYLNRTEIPEEEFSDSDQDEEEDDIDAKDSGVEYDEDDKEQQRLAKRFARRARMNRLLELHGDDEEFSQIRLIDQDQSMQLELKSIKNVHSKRRDTSISSFSLLGENSSTHGFPKRQTSSNGPLSSKYLSSTSSLALAMNRSRKRKASFLGTASNGKAASKTPALSLGHVVFGGDSHPPITSRSASLPVLKNSVSSIPCKRSKSDSGSKNSSSLWSRVAAAGFIGHKK